MLVNLNFMLSFIRGMFYHGYECIVFSIFHEGVCALLASEVSFKLCYGVRFSTEESNVLFSFSGSLREKMHLLQRDYVNTVFCDTNGQCISI